MDISIKNIRTLLEEITTLCDANWIALSGGLDSSILGQIKKGQDLNAITIITKDFLGTDLEYSQIMGKHIDIPLELKYVSIDEIFDAIKNTIKILKNFNDIEIRNSIVSYLYLNALKEKNVKKVITGDGADEIFAGYNFLIKKEHAELKTELKRMKKIMHFTSEKIANELGISVQMPYIDQNIIKLVETLPINYLVNEKNGTKFGKWVLRKAFENDLPSSISTVFTYFNSKGIPICLLAICEYSKSVPRKSLVIIVMALKSCSFFICPNILLSSPPENATQLASHCKVISSSSVLTFFSDPFIQYQKSYVNYE